jgi:hypothetical protein
MMTGAFAEVSSTVAAAGTAWDVLAPRGRAALARLAGLEAAVAGIGRAAQPALAGLRTRLDGLVDRLATDPLGISPAEFDGLDRDLSSAEDTVAAVERLRSQLAPRLVAARNTLEELRTALATADEAHRAASAKVTGAGAEGPPQWDATMADELARVASMADRGDWMAASAALGRWEATASDVLQRAAASTSADQAAIDARNELRGLLDAYSVMAARSGALERPLVAERHQRAHDALYTAPTDLEQAAALVRAFQELLVATNNERGCA